MENYLLRLWSALKMSKSYHTPQIGDITNVALNRRIMLKTWERWRLRCFCWDYWEKPRNNVRLNGLQPAMRHLPEGQSAAVAMLQLQALSEAMPRMLGKHMAHVSPSTGNQLEDSWIVKETTILLISLPVPCYFLGWRQILVRPSRGIAMSLVITLYIARWASP